MVDGVHANGARAFNVGDCVVDEYGIGRFEAAGAAYELVNCGIRLGAFDQAGNRIVPEAAEEWMGLLKQLRYRPTAVVRKRRRIYRMERDGFAVEVCLDDVERVGRFVELEIQAPEEKLDPARSVLLALANAWGLGPTERRSYLELLLSQSRTP